MRFLALVLLLFAALAARAEEPAPTVVCDFETGEPTSGWTTRNLAVAETPTPHGRGLKLLASREEGDDGPRTIGRASDVRDWRRFRAFSLRVKVAAEKALALRLLVTGPQGRGCLLHRFTAEPGDWRDVVLPLEEFRDDGQDAAGSFAAVERLSLQWDQGVGEIDLDDLRLLPGDRGPMSCRPTGETLQRLAFGDAKSRRTEGLHFLVLDDAPQIPDADVASLLARLEEGLALLDRRYGVTGELGDKVPFFLFATRAEYEGFAKRLGERYGAIVAPPKADGYSIFGVGMGSFDAKQGWNRPVYVHEALHGAIHRLLGVASNGNWVQEALASAVQAQLHPASLDASKLAAGFEARAGWIAPWSKVFEKPRVGMNAYPEILSIADFLAERHRGELPRVWEAVRALREPLHAAAPAAIAKALGTDAAKLEEEWLAWGGPYYRAKAK